MEKKNKSGKNWIWDAQVSVQEVCFDLFFGLLLLAKGIGLYDGQGSFKVFLVAALLCWCIKMCLTRYSVKELLVIALFLGLGGAAYLLSGEKAALISVMVVVGMKDVSVKRVFQIGLVLWTICFAGQLLLALTGVTEPLLLVHDKGALGFVIRNSLGFTHPNVLHVSYTVLAAFWLYFFRGQGKKVWGAVGLAFLGNLYVFLYSLSYTGFAMMTAYLILVVYFTYRPELNRAEKAVVQCLMPLCVCTSLLAPILLKGKVFDAVDKIVNWRLRLSRRYLIWENLSWFGSRIEMDRGSIDCSYVYCFLYYGIVLFALFMLGYFLLIRHLVKTGRNRELAIVLGMVAAGFTEPFQFNFSFKNLILLFLGEYLFTVLLAKRGTEGFWKREVGAAGKARRLTFPRFTQQEQWTVFSRSAWKQGRCWIVAACLAGVVGGALYGKYCVSVPPYIVVNREYSDRIGEKEEYEIFGELSEKIIENSFQIHCDGPDTKVYVFEGSTVQMEKKRNMISAALAGGIILGAVGFSISVLLQKISYARINKIRQ